MTADKSPDKTEDMPDDPWDLEYWTTSTCATCGIDGWNLTHAQMEHIRVVVHTVLHYPDPVVSKAEATGVPLPFFTDKKHTGFWPKIKDYLNNNKAKGIKNGNNDTAVQQ